MIEIRIDLKCPGCGATESGTYPIGYVAGLDTEEQAGYTTRRQVGRSFMVQHWKCAIVAVVEVKGDDEG